jgi:hypothetical protein
VNQRFGPRLDAYCQQRDKQYGKDWVFVYQYALGRKGGGESEKYIKITYDMTPEDVKDNEQPHIKLRDMDTISVMKAKQYTTMDANKKNGVETPLSPIGSQVSEDEVDIIDGETRVFQNAGTISEWQRKCEEKMGQYQECVVQLKQYIARQKEKLAKQEKMIANAETYYMNVVRANLRAQHAARGQVVGQAQAVGHGQAVGRGQLVNRAQTTVSQAAGRAQPTRQPFAQQSQPFTGFSDLSGRSESQVRAMVAAGYKASMARQAAARTQQLAAQQQQVSQQQQMAQPRQQMTVQQQMAREYKMGRQQLSQFRFPAPSNNTQQDRRPTYASGPREPFPKFVDPDGLPLFNGQDNPPPGFQSPPVYPGYASALPSIPSVQPQGNFWDGLPAQFNMPPRRDASVSEAGSKVAMKDEDSVMGEE